jgi:hypothetical protein
LIIGQNKRVINDIQNLFKARFQMKDLGDAKYLLGWQICRNRQTREIFLHQQTYAEKVLARFEHQDCHPLSIPSDPQCLLTKAMCPTTSADKAAMETIPFREAVGSFIYLAMGTRPDLAFFIRDVSQYLSNPGKPHWKAIKRGLRYLKGTTNYGITLGGKEALTLATRGKSLITGYTDASYAMCEDTRKSIGGFITFIYDSPISWASKKFPIVTLSSTEAEYIALCYAVQELLYLRQLSNELGVKTDLSIPVYEDNQSTIKMANNVDQHGRSKHIDVRHYFVKEKVANKEFNIQYVSTHAMIADIFTKPLPQPAFEKFRSMMRVQSYNDWVDKV